MRMAQKKDQLELWVVQKLQAPEQLVMEELVEDDLCILRWGGRATADTFQSFV